MEIGITDKNDQPIKIGTKVRFVPDRSDKGFMNSNFGEWVEEFDLGVVYFEFIENVYGLLGFSYIITADKSNGEPFTDGDQFPELLDFKGNDSEEFKEEGRKLAARISTETLTEYGFINYVSKKNRFEII